MTPAINQNAYDERNSKTPPPANNMTPAIHQNASDEEDRFTAGQAGYNPIQQQWAVTAVHQILESRAQAQSEEEYNLLTQEAKKLSYAHQIVSPVVSFLVRKPKSSLNLINSRLGEDSDERERRSSTQQQETHEIR